MFDFCECVTPTPRVQEILDALRDAASCNAHQCFHTEALPWASAPAPADASVYATLPLLLLGLAWLVANRPRAKS